MSQDLADGWAEEERRRALGDVRLVSNRIMAPQSDALREATERLLGKAVAAVVDGDEERARRLVQRALALPVDEHEGVQLTWGQVSLMLYLSISDAFDLSEDGDETWLDAAEHVLAACDPLAAPALRSNLAAMADELGRGPQARRCRRLAAGTTADAWDDAAPGDEGERLSAVVAVVRAIAEYEAYA